MKRPYIISHMMVSVDGRIDCPMVAQISGETAVFDGCHWQADSPYHLKLKSVEQVEGTETIWLRYLCK